MSQVSADVYGNRLTINAQSTKVLSIDESSNDNNVLHYMTTEGHQKFMIKKNFVLYANTEIKPCLPIYNPPYEANFLCLYSRQPYP